MVWLFSKHIVSSEIKQINLEQCPKLIHLRVLTKENTNSKAQGNPLKKEKVISQTLNRQLRLQKLSPHRLWFKGLCSVQRDKENS